MKDTAPSALDPLRPILREWEQLHLAAAKSYPDDPAFWSSEATNCAVLSTAAWQAGGIGLVELPFEQKSPDGASKGHIDLWIRSGGSERAQEHVVEAKQVLLHQRDHDSRVEAIRESLRLAERAAASVEMSWDVCKTVQRVAVVFAVPKLLEIEPLKQFDARLAVDFPDCIRQMVETPAPAVWDGRFFPGAFLLARQVD